MHWSDTFQLSDKLNAKNLHRMTWALAVCFLLCFLHTYFLNPRIPADAKLRFHELPYYGLFTVFLLVIAGEKINWRRRFWTVVLTLWTALPVLATQRPLQWWLNGRYLMENIKFHF